MSSVFNRAACDCVSVIRTSRRRHKTSSRRTRPAQPSIVIYTTQFEGTAVTSQLDVVRGRSAETACYEVRGRTVLTVRRCTVYPSCVEDSKVVVGHNSAMTNGTAAVPLQSTGRLITAELLVQSWGQITKTS